MGIKRTFSLLELIIVILVIGILAGVSIPRYQDSIKASKFETFESNLKQIVKNLEQYKANQMLNKQNNLTYPPSLSDPSFKAMFVKEPINPYTNKSMLGGNPTDSGILYQPIGTSYKLCIVQRDVDDVNNNGVVEEVLPLSTKTACIGNTQTSVMLYYNGNDNYVHIPFIKNTTFGSQFTIEMLVNISPSIADTEENPVLFSISRTKTDYTNEALLELIPTGQGAKLRFWDYSTDFGFPGTLSTTVLYPNQTYHIAFVKNGLTGTYYVNGQPAGTASAADDVHYGNDNVYLGSDFRDNGSYYNGYMDEVRIWNVARSATEIQADMNRELEGNEPGLVGYWRLNEGTGTTIYDSTSNRSNGTINGAQWVINYTASGTRTSPEYNISTAGTVESATITWTASTPAGTSVAVETRVSLDGGNTWTSWQTVASGSAVPGLPKGTNLANARIQLRQTLSTTNSATTPQLQDVRIQIVSTATGGIRVDVKQIP